MVLVVFCFVDSLFVSCSLSALIISAMVLDAVFFFVVPFLFVILILSQIHTRIFKKLVS